MQQNLHGIHEKARNPLRSIYSE